MGSRVSQWGPLEWEAYALKQCDENKPPGTDFVRYESNETWVCGRASLIRDWQRKIIVIQFRGTSNAQNVLNDLLCCSVAFNNIARFPLMPNPVYTNMTIHNGFCKEYKALQKKLFTDQLYSEIQIKNSAEGWHVLFTGHSLGGALATLCLADFLLHRAAVKVNKIALVTFGAPRVGNTYFANWINNSLLHMNLRVEVQYDPFTTLPAENGGTFSHCGKSVSIKPGNERFERVSVSDAYGENYGLLKEFGNELSKVLNLPSFVVSALGAVVDAYSYQIFEGCYRNDYFFRHGAYWDCRQYQEINIESAGKIVDLARIVINVQHDVGWGNTLYIRGSGPYLSWYRGIPMTSQGRYWKWEVSGETLHSFSFKVLKNDRDWEDGSDHYCTRDVTLGTVRFQ